MGHGDLQHREQARAVAADSCTPHRHFAPPFRGWSARVLIYGAVWIIALVLTLLLADASAAAWVRRTIPSREWAGLFKIAKAPGHFAFTLVVAAAVARWHPGKWRAATFACACGILSGLLCALFKWGFGRIRPFHGSPALELHPFINGLRGLFGAENLSFPSGHTSLAFATASAMTVLLPRWWSVFYGVALVVAAERILQGSHYPGDVLAAAGLGILSTVLVCWAYHVSTHVSGARTRGDLPGGDGVMG